MNSIQISLYINYNHLALNRQLFLFKQCQLRPKNVIIKKMMQFNLFINRILRQMCSTSIVLGVVIIKLTKTCTQEHETKNATSIGSLLSFNELW